MKYIILASVTSLSFNISPSSEYSGLISFKIDWFDLLAVQETLKSLLQHHSSKASFFWALSLLYGPTLTSIHDYWKNHSFDYTHLCWQCLCFLILCLGLSWRRQWHPTPVLLPRISHGQRSLVGCSPWGQ